MTEYEIRELTELVEMAEECAMSELAAFGFIACEPERSEI